MDSKSDADFARPDLVVHVAVVHSTSTSARMTAGNLAVKADTIS
jgi:hypothetical protein